MVGGDATAGSNFPGIVAPKFLGGFTRSSSVDTGRLGDPEAKNGVAEIEIDRVGSRSDTAARKAKPAVGNDLTTGDDIPTDIFQGTVFGAFTTGPFVASSRLSNLESAGAAEVDGVRSRSEADGSIRIVNSFDMAPSKVDVAELDRAMGHCALVSNTTIS